MPLTKEALKELEEDRKYFRRKFNPPECVRPGENRGFVGTGYDNEGDDDLPPGYP